MTDWQTEASLTRRIPRDRFEEQLFRRIIKSELARWANVEEPRFIAELGDYQDGAWTLHISKPHEEFGIGSFLTVPYLLGRIWVDEREYPASEYYRVAVSWELGSQSNTGIPPVLAWDLENPAGPW